jgi:hypothetical protein
VVSDWNWVRLGYVPVSQLVTRYARYIYLEFIGILLGISRFSGIYLDFLGFI